MTITFACWRNPKLSEREIGIGIMAAAMVAGSDLTALAYTPGQIEEKSQPIIGMIQELAGPVAFGSFTWACIRYALHQKMEAKDQMKSAAWGYFLVQMAPTLMGMIKDIR